MVAQCAHEASFCDVLIYQCVVTYYRAVDIGTLNEDIAAVDRCVGSVPEVVYFVGGLNNRVVPCLEACNTVTGFVQELLGADISVYDSASAIQLTALEGVVNTIYQAQETVRSRKDCLVGQAVQRCRIEQLFLAARRHQKCAAQQKKNGDLFIKMHIFHVVVCLDLFRNRG